MVGKGRVNESESESRSMLLDAGRRTVHVCMSGMYALRYAQGRCSSVLLERFPITTSTVRVFANVMLYHVLPPPPVVSPPAPTFTKDGSKSQARWSSTRAAPFSAENQGRRIVVHFIDNHQRVKTRTPVFVAVILWPCAFDIW